MKSIAIIPVRMAASRFPGKPMAKILGVPMIGHCYFRTKLCPELAQTYVATCDEEIADYVRSIGGKAVMTSSSHNRASDRTAEAMMKIEAETGGKTDIIIMVQGDEPLILPETISKIPPHFADGEVNIVNIASRLRSREQFEDRNNVKVVMNQRGDAMYFSREPIPSSYRGAENLPMYMQVGVIAFRRDALVKFNSMPETKLEQIESVDMNRVLETGGNIRMVMSEAINIGVDTPQELEDVAALMKDDPIFPEYA